MTDAVPPYVPPHLRGRVGDFRQEPDGKISFSDPSRAKGLGPGYDRTTISQDQYRDTFDERHRWANLESSLMDQYDSPARPPSAGWLSDLQKTTIDKLRGGLRWGTSDQGRSVATMALLSGLLGGGAAAFMASRNGESPWGRGALAALLAGAAGGGGTALLQGIANRRQQHQTKAAFAINQLIEEAVIGASDLSKPEKLALLRAVDALDQDSKERLARVIKGAGGAAVGAILVRFLGAKGLLPMALGGILGAVIASRPSVRRNPMGQVVT